MNWPVITPLLLFTGGMASLVAFFGVRHLIMDKELRLDHNTQRRLETKTEQLDYDAMQHVAKDPAGRFTKTATQEHANRDQRLQDLRANKEAASNDKL
jgi:hypothetical protein